MVNTRLVSLQKENTGSTRETLSASKLGRSTSSIGTVDILTEFASSTWRSLLTMTDNNMAMSKKQQRQERVLMVNRPHKKQEQHKSNHDVTALNRKIQNSSFSLEDPRPHDWNPKDPLLIAACIRQKQIH